MAAKTRFELEDAAIKRGKAKYWAWHEAKRTGQDIEELKRRDEELRQQYRDELVEYEKYVYGTEGAKPERT